MRNACINERKFVALNYIGETDVLDLEGYKTGEKTISYSDEIECIAQISGATTLVSVNNYGTNVAYDKVITMPLKKFKKYGLTENSILFIDREPRYDNGVPLYDYKIVEISQTINEVRIAIKQVRDEMHNN